MVLHLRSCTPPNTSEGSNSRITRTPVPFRLPPTARHTRARSASSLSRTLAERDANLHERPAEAADKEPEHQKASKGGAAPLGGLAAGGGGRGRHEGEEEEGGEAGGASEDCELREGGRSVGRSGKGGAWAWGDMGRCGEKA